MSLEPMQDAIGAILDRLGVSDPSSSNRVIDEWAAVAGPPWDTKANPRSVLRKELVVEVANGRDASILRYQVGDLLRRIDEAVGPGIVETVRIKVAR